MIDDYKKNRIQNSKSLLWVKMLLSVVLLIALIVGILYSIRLSNPQNMTELREYSARRYAVTSIPEHTFKIIQIGDRIAVYYDVKGLRQQELEAFLAEPYADGIYQVKGEDNLKYLIIREESGTLIPVEFCYYEVTDDPYKQEHLKYTALGTNAHQTADFSPYSYAEAMKEIYGIDGPEDIVRITVTPKTENNTSEMAAIKKEIGSQNLTDREAIETFYNAMTRAVCLGGSNNDLYYTMPDRFTYSFSPETKGGKRTGEGVTEEELTRAVRYLTVRLKDGTILDRWKYDAIKGCFYEYEGVVTEPLEEADVYALNAVFGIE